MIRTRPFVELNSGIRKQGREIHLVQKLYLDIFGDFFGPGRSFTVEAGRLHFLDGRLPAATPVDWDIVQEGRNYNSTNKDNARYF